MVTQGDGTKIGPYYVVSGAFHTQSKLFEPVFVIHEGGSASGRIVHSHQHQAENAFELSTVEDAFDTADEMAGRWIAEHQAVLN
jgi:hypothetical protein